MFFVIAGSVALVAALLMQPVVLDGETHLALFGLVIPSTCWFKLTTGLPCAGCGLTRSIVLLLHGHPAASLAMHPFGPWIVALAMLGVPPRLVRRDGTGPAWIARWDRAWLALGGLTVLLMLAWWVQRVGLVRAASVLFRS